ncbi:carbohydrate kinase family protein [Zeimonas arvi]|uniref:Carbohydrate kinase family protein n=1 Tax=Zeimonas arvi TaxID=2498847 RepID=A0A5C8P556_9BURK|nr:carbohydrate kinase family protein [Zeimonas arvi]TXL68792.1 carbohydrate kinase family protein [Zeimonas arvi]
MSRRVLISGSVAYDTIMVFEGHFRDHILPDRVHMLNVAFLTPRLKREFGGCAANIAYNLQSLGGEAVVLAAVGHDGEPFLKRLRALGVDTAPMLRCEDLFTAQAFITTDLSDNQITAFHPGAMSEAHRVSASQAAQAGAAWGIVAPNGRDAMLSHAREFSQAGVPWLFDPGQGLPMFDGAELREFVEQASAVAVNDYEAGLLTERTGWSEEEIASRVQAMIVTRGAEGSVLYEGGRRQLVEAVAVKDPVDPTGCGDAYRGGLLYGLSAGWSWRDAARLGSLMGALKIAHQGAQNHPVSRDEVAARYGALWGTRPW